MLWGFSFLPCIKTTGRNIKPVTQNSNAYFSVSLDESKSLWCCSARYRCHFFRRSFAFFKRVFSVNFLALIVRLFLFTPTLIWLSLWSLPSRHSFLQRENINGWISRPAATYFTCIPSWWLSFIALILKSFVYYQVFLVWVYFGICHLFLLGEMATLTGEDQGLLKFFVSLHS